VDGLYLLDAVVLIGQDWITQDWMSQDSITQESIGQNFSRLSQSVVPVGCPSRLSQSVVPVGWGKV
jgi:hypothetical protein